jgi:leader peptidase (prepilin peptidase) / N-methyltransferase
LRIGGGDWRVPTIALGAIAVGLGAVVALITTDLRQQILPTSLNALLGLAGLIFHWSNGWAFASFGELVAGAALGAGLLLGLRQLYLALRHIEALGLGDVKFMAAAGLWVGAANVPLLLAIAALGTLLTILALYPFAAQGESLRSRPFPFGPGLCVALVIVSADLTGWLP